MSQAMVMQPAAMDSPKLQWLTAAVMVEPAIRSQLAACWLAVANTGGAVGFAVLPVSAEQVTASVDSLVRSLHQSENHLLTATVNGELAGWLLLNGNTSSLTAHWARVARVQTAPAFRGTGVGRALMAEVARAAFEDFALEHLHLKLRGGMDLEGFYESCGWREIGRRPSALRLPSGDQDEVLMSLSPGT